MTPAPIVLKLGGEVIAGAQLPVVAADVAALVREGQRVVVVHGGGPQATKLSAELGIKTVQIAGRRVTDERTLDVMKMIVAGKLNVDLCGALVAAGAKPVGLHGASARVIAAEKRPPKEYAGHEGLVDLGLVGDVTGLDRSLLTLLLDAGYTPVLACLGAGADGAVYNINADTVATRAAVLLDAAGLVLISDVPGVLRDVRDPSSRIASLSVAEGRALIASGIVTKGMIPKLEDSFEVLAQGVRRIHIVGRLGAGDLAREVRAPGSIGTVLTP